LALYVIPPHSTSVIIVVEVLRQFSFGLSGPILWAMMGDVADSGEWTTRRAGWPTNQPVWMIVACVLGAVTIPALELERLRNRHVLFFLDTISQYVDRQPELRDLPLANDVVAIAEEFGIAPDDAFGALRMALTARGDGPPLELLFPLLGHDRIMMRIGAVSSHILHGRGLEPIRFGPGGVPFETIRPRAPGDGS